MLPGFSGHLVSEQFIEQRLTDALGMATAERFREGLTRWLHSQRTAGPASSERSLLHHGAHSLLALLGFSGFDQERPLAHGGLSVSARAGAASIVLIVSRYGEPLDPLWRVAVNEAATRQAEWCLLFNGTHARLINADRVASRRFVEFDLEAAGDDERTGAALQLLAHANSLLADSRATHSTTALVEASDAHGHQVCRSLRQGVLDAAAQVAGALFARARRATIDEAFAQALTLVYRLLFLFFAEARGLVPMWHAVYRDSYSVQRLCALTDDSSSRGLWEAVQAVGRLAHAGCHAGDLRVTAYNGRLFAPSRAPLVELPKLAEDAARRALVALSTRPAADREGREPIAYRDLGVEQLGAVYETLLDYTPTVVFDPDRRATPTVTLDVGASARKRTGSFYTPEPIVRYLVRQTIGPLVCDATPEQILALRVLDPSMGSGAFLVGACHYLAEAYAEALVLEGRCHATDLGPPEHSAIRRLIAERCLFGVDINPMAVQLAQLSLWLTTLSSDRPLGFLDHHLVTGDSVLGVWLSALRQPPTRRRTPQDTPLLPDDPVTPMLRDLLPLRFSLNNDPTDTVEQVRRKERALADLSATHSPLSRWKQVADLWIARWLSTDLNDLSTLFPALADAILTGHGPLPARTATPFLQRAAAAATMHRPFHWELEFPEVFFTSDGQRRGDGGFDAIVGNPPWEMLRNDASTESSPSIGSAARQVRFARDAGIYRALGDGHVNCYQLFLERSLALLRPQGRIGMVLPWGLAADQGSAALRHLLFTSCRVEHLVGFENRKAIFDIHRSVRFVLLTGQSGTPTGEFRCRLGETDPATLEDACDDRGREHSGWWPLRMSPQLLDTISGPDLAIPDVRTPLDLAIVERLTSRFRRLGDIDGWQASFGRELNATDDRDVLAPGARRAVPVVEGKHLDPFRVRVADARVSMSDADADARLGGRHARMRLAYRDVASASNRQTLIAAMLPAQVASTHTVLCLKTALPRRAQWFLCGLFNSFVVNYLVRRRVATHVTTTIVERLPVPTESEAGAGFGAIAAAARLLAREWQAEVAAELEGRVARLYALTVEEYAHILTTFPLADTAARDAAMRVFSQW